LGIEGGLSGRQKLNNLRIIKGIILKELNEIARITSENLGKKYECHVNCKLEVSIIPNNIT